MGQGFLGRRLWPDSGAHARARTRTHAHARTRAPQLFLYGPKTLQKCLRFASTSNSRTRVNFRTRGAREGLLRSYQRSPAAARRPAGRPVRTSRCFFGRRRWPNSGPHAYARTRTHERTHTHANALTHSRMLARTQHTRARTHSLTHSLIRHPRVCVHASLCVCVWVCVWV